jgi:hypothetical protein
MAESAIGRTAVVVTRAGFDFQPDLRLVWIRGLFYVALCLGGHEV